MDRRSFLLGSTGALALNHLLAGCSSQEQVALSVQLLRGSIPAQVVDEFRATLKQPAKLKFTPTEQLKGLFDQLQSWRKPHTKPDDWRSWVPLPFVQSKLSALADLVTLGDYWLAQAIEEELILPLDTAQLRQWEQLPIQWQKLVTRSDKVWAAPYRWGSTVIAYNRNKFKSLGWTPSNWSDLWRPELRDRISLLAQPREVIGLTLKKLGKSYNTKNLDEVPKLEEELRALHKQVKFYSSDTYMQPLVLGDTWLAVGWSTDVLPVIQRYKQIAAVIPQSGTALWADLWVRPASNSSDNSLSEQWIDFCWQPQSALQISLTSKANSPIPVSPNPASLKEGLGSLLLSDPQILQRSEFLSPLPNETMQEYQLLWQSLRGA